MSFTPELAPAVAFLVLSFVLLLLCLCVFVTFASTWLQAFMSGAQVDLLDLIGMRLRRTDYKTVVRALIVARQGGVWVSPVDMERAWVQGVDLEKVTLAVIQATKNNMNVTFEELVDAEVEERLARLLEETRSARLEEPAYR